MPFLVLTAINSGELLEFRDPDVRIGRDPGSTIVVSGEQGRVVSTNHARLVHESDRWWLEDAGSRNGTFVGARRLEPGERYALAGGTEFRLGGSGPHYRVERTGEIVLGATMVEGAGALASTMVESAGGPAKADAQDFATQIMGPGPSAPSPQMTPPPAALPNESLHAAVLRSVATGRVFFIGQGRTRVGHGTECQIKLGSSTDTVVARVHAEIASGQDGSVVVWDGGSKTGTIVNGRKITGVHRLVAGDRIELGTGGPALLVEEVNGVTASGSLSRYTPQSSDEAGAQSAEAPAARAVAQAHSQREPATAPKAAPKVVPGAPKRATKSAGVTMFFKQMIEDAGTARDKRFNRVLWTTVAGLLTVLVIGVSAVWMVGERRVQRAEAELERQGRAMAARQQARDSIDQFVQDEANRLRAELTRAMATGSAPTATLDSLRVALSTSESRTTRLEVSLGRASTALNAQLSMGDSLRRQAQGDIARLRTEITRAGDDGASRRLVDSLRRAIGEAQQQATSIGAQVRAVRGTNLARVSQENQGATGLVNMYAGNDVFDGSGFVITASGYFITNRHVVLTESGAPADSVFVVMADARTMLSAEVIAVGSAKGPDLAVLKLRGYSGAWIRNIDWAGGGAAQGEPAALIGFPAGGANAVDSSGTVRTSMSAGIFSKVTSEVIQFDGFTVGGSSGSPIFNASGEVVAVHRAGLRQAAGLSFAVPVARVAALLPAAAKAELGLK